MRDNGLNELFIQQYLGNDELYDHSKMKDRMIKKIAGLGVEYSVISDIQDHRIEYELHIPGIASSISFWIAAIGISVIEQLDILYFMN